MKKIVFITGSLSQPRIIKRVKSIYDAGFPVSVYGFDRGVYNSNSFPSDITVNVLGLMKDGTDYLAKIKKTKETVREIIMKEGKDNTIFYSFGLIGAYYLFKQEVKYAYELSDILYGYPKFSKIRFFLKNIEKRIIRHSVLTVMTSEGFSEFLFKTKQLPQIIIQPNKLSPYFNGSTRPKFSDFDINKLRFAFVGAIRYPNTILRFAKIIGENFPNHEFHFYGESIYSKQFAEETHGYKNIFFHGKYKNPEDLTQIYNQIDIIVATYHTDSLNERIAEPNKLYESIYFSKPIIVSKNTFLEKQVDQLKCGVAIDCYSEENIKSFISKLSIDWIKDIRYNEMCVQTELLIDNPYMILERLKLI